MAGIKLSQGEIQQRVNECFKLRFEAEHPILQKEWIKHCHKIYGDKSEKQYHQYWIQSKELYDEQWRAKLDRMLDPAMNELFNLLADEDSKIRQRAVDQIVKYTGNEQNKLDIDLKGEMNISLNWGDIIETDPGDEQE